MPAAASMFAAFALATMPADAETKIIVPKNIGKYISVRGKFSSRGKLGPFLKLRERDEPVYLLPNQQTAPTRTATKLWFAEGADITARGTLLYRAGVKQSTAEPVADAGNYYYVDISTVQLIKH